MRLSQEAATQRPAIERMLKYVADDGVVASYFRIARHEVQAIRAEMPEDDPRRFKAERYEPESAGDGSGAQPAAKRDLEERSRHLREAIERLFRKFERDHGFQAGAGKILLPAGWSEKMRRAA